MAPAAYGTGTIALPEPQGFSGCGVWHLALGTNATFPESALVLGGIVHRYNSELMVIRATRLEVLLHMIGSATSP
jgi:hypothetical protein